VENKERSRDNQSEPYALIPLKAVAKIKDRKHRKNRQRDDFLNRFQLRWIEFVGTNPICRNLEAVLKESDTPTGQNHFPQGFSPESQVTIPGESHEDIGKR
jgi:hypothetical protein